MTIEEKAEKLDFESFKGKLGLWGPRLKPFIESKEMWDIYQTIKEDSRTERIVPDSSNTFRAFSTTDPDTLKVVFLLMDPYPRLYKGGNPQATGIAMDCSNSSDGKLQPSLELFYDAIERSSKGTIDRSPSLEYLHEQGVMFLNSDLTCKVNKTQSHEGLWEPFMKYLFTEVLSGHTNVIHVLCGKASQKLEKYINPFCPIFKLEHPAAAAHKHTDWKSEGIFNTINNILKDNRVDPIFWSKKEWKDVCDLPF